MIDEEAPHISTTLLVIDDNEDDQRLYKRFDNLFNLVMASSANAGFERIAEFMPDLILLDYNLPDLDGLGFIKKLSGLTDTPIPIIMLTGEGNVSVAVEAMKCGAADYLVKDVGGQYLKLLPSVVSRVLAAHAQRERAKQMQMETGMLLRRNQLFMQNSLEGIHITDMQGNIIEANDAFCRMLGYTQEEVARLNIRDWEVLHSEDEVRENFNSIIDKSMLVETIHRRKDGELINVETSASGVLMGNQRLVYSSSRDITERKKIEFELRDREALLNAVMKGLPVGVWVTDKAGKIIFGNDFAQQLLSASHDVKGGITTGRFGERSDLRPEWGKSIATLERIASQAIKGGDIPLEEEIEIACPDGAHKTILNIAHSYCGTEGGIIGTVIVSKDLTQRKQTELRKLQDSDLRFRGTLEQLAVGIIHASLDGCFQQTNQKFCEIIGYSREELLRMSFREITFFADLAGEEEPLLQLLAGKISTFSREQRYVRKDQSLAWVNLTISLLRKTDGVPVYYIGVVEDISERKHAEVLAQQYGHLLQSSFDEIYLFDADTLHFLLTSEGAERNLGYSDEELNQLTPLDLEPSFNREDFERRVAPLRSGERQSITFESEHLRKNGTTYLTEVRLQLMNADYPVFMSIIQDVTERRQADMEISRSRQLLRDLVMQSERLREEERKHIARELHDELGQILTALRMNVALLRIEFGVNDAVLLEKIKGITELLDQSIQCTRDVVSNLRPAALDTGIVSAVRWLRDEFVKHSSTSCKLFMPEEEIHLDEAIAVSAFRVVQESLTNVARYAEANKVEITLGQDADNFSVTVNDNGKGFDYMAIQHKKTFGLLGMRERAIALGGVLNIYSAPQEGTQIFFAVPNKQTVADLRGDHP
ncbi:MAG: PAS domain S-box protein [Gallionellaceae bacterium]|nr:MAG: PAS domain S-box protein [Gallionellaceae bacterium]